MTALFFKDDALNVGGTSCNSLFSPIIEITEAQSEQLKEFLTRSSSRRFWWFWLETAEMFLNIIEVSRPSFLWHKDLRSKAREKKSIKQKIQSDQSGKHIIKAVKSVAFQDAGAGDSVGSVHHGPDSQTWSPSLSSPGLRVQQKLRRRTRLLLKPRASLGAQQEVLFMCTWSVGLWTVSELILALPPLIVSFWAKGVN